MIDVLHVLFEEDATPSFENHEEIKSRVRETLYGDLYGRKYRYALKRQTPEQEALDFDPDMELPDAPPKKLPVKPFIPATDPEDLPGILDRPLG